MKKPITILFAISLLAAGCGQSIRGKTHSFVPQEGDLLFQDLDCGPICDAIEKVTAGYHGANFSHVGIVAKDDNDNLIVIEASSNGIQATQLQTFLSRSFDTNHRPKAVVGRLRPNFRHLIPLALKQAAALKGSPYDKEFVINNEAYYCSELIYEIFLHANGNSPVFALQPMTFKDPNTETTLPAWQKYFAELAAPIPEGRPGINPGSISRSPALTIVHIYGNPSGWKNRPERPFPKNN
jgi:hypothetical protein